MHALRWPAQIRRRALVGAALAFAFAPSVFAQQSDWNGTWAGYWETGHGAQIIFAGNDLIGIYWHDDYIENAEGSVSADGGSVTITWPGAHALLTRDGAQGAKIVIRETGRPDVSFPLTRDHS
ncbi:MAG TPA: hypothetical protein VHQ39_02830 [Dongiaceae bacterium]|jgi:hypothetical protein|nr:hypothetical protein [Dongiaceae bacterium]